MSQFLDSLFISFSGEPITGRVPPRVVLHGEVSPEVIAEAAHSYDTFRKQRGVSIIDTHIAEDFLAGGGFMAVHSHGDIDEIEIWGDAPQSELKLPHALVVVASWRAKPTIYKRVEQAGSQRKWVIDKTPVPQAVKPIRAYNSVEFAASGSPYYIMPAAKNSVTLWGVDRRAAPNIGQLTQDRLAVPINMRIGSAVPAPHAKAHYSYDGKVFDGAATLYTMTPPSNILLSGLDGLNYLPSGTTTNGKELALNMYRSAAITETIKFLRTAGERIKRTAESTYERVERFDTDVVLPPLRNDIKETAGEVGPLVGIWTFSNGRWNEFRYSLDQAGYYSYTATGSHNYGEVWHLGPLLQPVSLTQHYFAQWGVVFHAVVASEELYSKLAFTKGFGQIIGDETDHGVVAALTERDVVQYARLFSRFSYPMEGVIRGGEISTYTYSSYYFGDTYPLPYWMNLSKAGRKDLSSFASIADGIVRLELGWTDVKVMDLKGVGSMTGSYDITNKNGLTNIDQAFIDEATTSDYVDHDVVPPSYPDDAPWPRIFVVGVAQHSTWAAGHPSISAEIATNKANNDGLVPGSPTETFCHNACSYDYITDYIIDYDHRARFCAMLRVRVQADGHHYTDQGAPVRGIPTNKVRDPMYTVTISFVSRWMNSETASIVSASVELVKEQGVTRQAFEMYRFEYTNPYAYPFGEADGVNKMKVKLPPRIALPLELTTQFANLSRHQGVNPNFAGENYDPTAVPHRSSKGIEFSVLAGNRGRLYHKYPPGMLYARTFKLSDFSDALWLLRALKIDATENDLPGSSETYFYFPVIGGNLASTRHVELRDGVLTTWSDNLPATEGEIPAVWARNIELYRV